MDDMEEQEEIGVEIRLVKSWPEEEIISLYKAGGWWKEHYDPDKIHEMIMNSFAFAVALEEDHDDAVGMGRVISDGFSDAYIQDVVVLEEFRGRGVGRSIVKALVDHCVEEGLVWIGLIAEEGTGGFYKPAGFRDFPGQPMVFEPGDD